jgi:hypothetical protein
MDIVAPLLIGALVGVVWEDLPFAGKVVIVLIWGAWAGLCIAKVFGQV